MDRRVTAGIAIVAALLGSRAFAAGQSGRVGLGQVAPGPKDLVATGCLHAAGDSFTLTNAHVGGILTSFTGSLSGVTGPLGNSGPGTGRGRGAAVAAAPADGGDQSVRGAGAGRGAEAPARTPTPASAAATSAGLSYTLVGGNGTELRPLLNHEVEISGQLESNGPATAGGQLRIGKVNPISAKCTITE